MLAEKSVEPVGELAVHAALVLMRVPAAHIGERGLDAEVGFEQLRNLLHAVAEFGVGIVDAGRGRVLRGVGGAQHLHRVEGLIAGGVKDAVAASRHTWLQRRWRRARAWARGRRR